MFLTSILALTDFSADGERALARAGQIAREHGAALRLMYMPFGKHPQCLDADTRLSQTAIAMEQRLELTVRTVGAGNHSLDNVLLQAARDCRCPVLVVHGAKRRRLRQIVVGIDFTSASHHRAMLACLLDRDAKVELFHAVSATGESQLRRADLDRSVRRRYRDNCIEHARVQLGQMTQSLYAHSMPVVSWAQIGEPAEQLMARLALTGADLVLVGKRRRSAAIDCLLRSTAHELLAQAQCDVMVVPEDFKLSATRSAVQRLKDPAPQWPPWPAIGRQ